MPPTMTTSLRTAPDGDIEIIDQLLLPHTTAWVPVRTIADAHGAIKRMQIRGAPAIASLAALSLARELELALAAQDAPTYLASVDSLRAHVGPTLDYLNTARPTAVNLGQAMRRLRTVLKSDGSSNARELAESLIATARLVAAEDVGRNREMARHGAEWVLDRIAQREGQRRKLNVLTVCNTGSLATSGYGTALGVITHLFETGFLERAYYTQSTPYHQGSRLTALELKTLGAPSCMVCDSMVGSLLQHHKIDAVLVGADRIAANGDTANKVGTYNAAVLAARHGVPLLVVAPVTTVDLDIADGSQIPIEHRPPLEACTARGALMPPQLDAAGQPLQATVLITPVLSAIADAVGSRAAPVAPSTPSQDADAKGPLGGPGEADALLQQVYNPSFDVTPAELIAAVVTEKGVAVKADGHEEFALRESGVV